MDRGRVSAASASSSPAAAAASSHLMSSTSGDTHNHSTIRSRVNTPKELFQGGGTAALVSVGFPSGQSQLERKHVIIVSSPLKTKSRWGIAAALGLLVSSVHQ